MRVCFDELLVGGVEEVETMTVEDQAVTLMTVLLWSLYMGSLLNALMVLGQVPGPRML